MWDVAGSGAGQGGGALPELWWPRTGIILSAVSD